MRREGRRRAKRKQPGKADDEDTRALSQRREECQSDMTGCALVAVIAVASIIIIIIVTHALLITTAIKSGEYSTGPNIAQRVLPSPSFLSPRLPRAGAGAWRQERQGLGAVWQAARHVAHSARLGRAPFRYR